MDGDFSKPRVNASMLPSYQGKFVCLLGKAKDVDNNGTSFTLTTSDGQDVKILLQEPLNEYVAGLTEVHGTVDQSNSIVCDNYIVFPQETSDSFDIGLYNDAVNLMSRFNQYYITGVQG